MFVHSFIMSRLDMNNSLLAGLLKTVLAWKDVITGTNATDHITPVIINLH